MDRPSSSSSKPTKTHLKKSSQIEQTTNKKQQHQQCSRQPLQALYPAAIVAAATATSNNSSCRSSSSSIEAPRGCLRFFLSHSSSSNSNTKTPFINRPTKGKALSKTPKSAPNPSKPSKGGVLQRPFSRKPERGKKSTPCLYQWQSGRKPSSKNASKHKNVTALSSSADPVNKPPAGRIELEVCRVNDESLTPLSKIATGSGLDFAPDRNVTSINGNDDEKMSNTSGNNNKTPPIQASVSPEIQIQCSGSSLAAKTTTPACYAAGYIVSGVTDKRKCRPRGVLTVGDNNLLDFNMAEAIDSFGEDDDDNGEENIRGVVDSNSSTLIVPLPAEASMHWLLSPCNEEDEVRKENSENRSCGVRIHSPSSSLFGDGHTSDLCNDNLIIASSPNCTPSCKVADLEEGRKQDYDLDGENSTFSTDTLGSGNIIQTPQSDTSTDRYVGLSWLKATSGQKYRLDSELDLATESLQLMSLSSKGYESIWDPNNSSFQFDCLTTPSDSVDLSQFQKILDDRASWMSTSTLGNVSQSQMRISWREGLVSRIFEMDEFDSCRYLSDEEEDVNGGHNNDELKSCQNPELNVDAGNYEILNNGSGSTEFVDTDLETEEKGERRHLCQLSCSCAESISTDGGDLAASGDSDWTLCYKNQLFKV
ncbi:hypothetical protein ACOSQ2_033392 [Xanthoceras sorbifolium]